MKPITPTTMFSIQRCRQRQAHPPVLQQRNKLVPGVETLPDFLLWTWARVWKIWRQDQKRRLFLPGRKSRNSAHHLLWEHIWGICGVMSTRAPIFWQSWPMMAGGAIPGHKQHLAYARLRAIETRQVEEAPIQAFLLWSIKGNNHAAGIRLFNKASIPVETGETFYVQYGDLFIKGRLLPLPSYWSGCIFTPGSKQALNAWLRSCKLHCTAHTGL